MQGGGEHLHSADVILQHKHLTCHTNIENTVCIYNYQSVPMLEVHG